MTGRADVPSRIMIVQRATGMDLTGHRGGRWCSMVEKRVSRAPMVSGDPMVSEICAGKRKPVGVVVRLLHKRRPQDRGRDMRCEARD